MKKSAVVLLLSLMFIISRPASADGFIVGAKIGVMDVDINAFDALPAIGILGGYEFDNLFPGSPISIGIEGEILTSLIDGDVGNYGSWDINTQALYGTVKLNGGIIYGKGKIGFLHEDVSISSSFFGASVDGSDTGLSAGLAVGFTPIDLLAIEGGWTLIEEDVYFYSIGVNFQF